MRHGSSRSKISEILPPLVILACGILLALFLFSGPLVAYDDYAYLVYAHQMLSGTFSLGASPYSYGFLYPMPIALSLWLFGTSIYSAALPQLVEYAAIVVLTFLIARRLCGRRTAYLAMFLVASAPFVVGYATRSVPDMLQGTIAALAIYILIVAVQSKEHRDVLFLTAGAVAMLSVYAQLLSIIFVFFFGVGVLLMFLMRSKKDRFPIGPRDLALTAAGAFISLLVYLSIFYILTGSPLFIYNYSNFQSSISYHNVFYNAIIILGIVYGFGPNSATLPLQTSLSFQSLFNQASEQIPIGPMVLWAIAGMVIAVKTKDKPLVLMSVVAFGFFFYLFFGTISLSSYTPAFVVSRYFIVIAAPLALLSAYGILKIYDVFCIPFKRKGGMLVLGCLLGITIIFNMPIYFVLYSYNQFTYVTSQLFSSALNTATAGTSGVVHLYIVDQDPISREIQWYGYYLPNVEAFVQFLSQYSANVVVNYTMNKSCSPLLGNQRLITFNLDNKTNTTLLTNAWLGDNCTATLVKNYTSPATPILPMLYNVTGK